MTPSAARPGFDVPRVPGPAAVCRRSVPRGAPPGTPVTDGAPGAAAPMVVARGCSTGCGARWRVAAGWRAAVDGSGGWWSPGAGGCAGLGARRSGPAAVRAPPRGARPLGRGPSWPVAARRSSSEDLFRGSRRPRGRPGRGPARGAAARARGSPWTAVRRRCGSAGARGAWGTRRSTGPARGGHSAYPEAVGWGRFHAPPVTPVLTHARARCGATSRARNRRNVRPGYAPYARPGVSRFAEPCGPLSDRFCADFSSD